MHLLKHHISLLPDRALLIEKSEKHLVVADVHLGKSAAFRARGLPVPEGDSARDLQRISDLILRHRPDQLIFAGDLFHSANGLTSDLIALLSEFVKRHSIPIVLVKGNHDQSIRNLPTFFSQPDHLDLEEIRIVHKPEDASASHFNICGHLHPIVKIPDGKRTALRMPCFHLRDNILTLPSFGSFTGGQIVQQQPRDRFFVNHQENVIELPEAIFSKKT